MSLWHVGIIDNESVPFCNSLDMILNASIFDNIKVTWKFTVYDDTVYR
jgi:hypothetical protein